jgi:hypothetical protein
LPERETLRDKGCDDGETCCGGLTCVDGMCQQRD